jgi:transposase
VDTLGLVLLVMVTAANVQDRDGARTLLSVLATQFRRSRVIWADGVYAGALPSWVRGLRKWGKVRVEIVRKAKGRRGFAVVPWRWIVERTFARLGVGIAGSSRTMSACRRLRRPSFASP